MPGFFGGAGMGAGFNAQGTDAALNAAPGLVGQPSTALAAGSLNDPAQAAQVLSMVQTALAQNAEADQPDPQHHRGLFASIGHAIASVAQAPGIKQGLEYLNKPLQEVQNDYRFIHEVYVKHGFFAGIAATAPIVGAAVAGGLAGPEGSVLAAEGTASLERQLVGRTVAKDAYDAANDPNTKISPGRDLAHLLGAGNTDKGFGKLLSGVGDATFDVVGDPLHAVGMANRAARLGKLADVSEAGRVSAPMRALAPGLSGRVASFIRDVAPGTAATTADGVETAYNAAYNVGVRRAFGEIANLDDPYSIIQRFPKLAALSIPLAAAKTPDAVKDVFKTAAEGGAVGDVKARAQAVADFLQPHGVPLDSVANVDRAVQTMPAVKDSLDDMAGMSDVRDIANAYPALAPLAADIAKAKDASAVGDVLRGSAFAAEMAKRINDGYLPSRSLLRIATSKLGEKVQNAGDSFDPNDPMAAQKLGLMAKASKTFTGYVPYSVDTATQEISRTLFDPNDPNSLQTVYRVMRLGMGNGQARYWTNKFAAAGSNTALKKSIYAQGVIEAAKAFGLPGDEGFLRGFVEDANAAVHGAAEGAEKYGHGLTLGDDVNGVPVGDVASDTITHTSPLALWENQRGKFAIPDFMEWTRAKRQLSWYGRTYGKLDDGARKFTNSVFKPLALVNAGFGQRVALSELIPQTGKYGFADSLRGMIQGVAAKAAVNLGEHEDSHIWQAAASALGGLGKAAGASEADRQLAVRLTVENDGQFLRGVARTGHNEKQISAMPFERADQTRQVMTGRNYPFRLLSQDAGSQYHGQWALGLSKLATQVPARQIAADLLALPDKALQAVKETGVLPQSAVRREAERQAGTAAMSPAVKAAYDRESQVLSRYEVQDSHEFAAHRVDSILGQVVGADGTVHRDLLERLRDGKKFDPSELEQIAPESAPQFIVGRTSDMVPTKRSLSVLVEKGFSHLVDPIINNLSRNPLYFNAVKEQYKALTEGADSALAHGLVDEDRALMLAQQRATHDILPMIHNTALRSQFSVLANNFMPFYFAQEQAFKRAGNAILDNPYLFREYQLINHGLSDPAFVHTDDQGNRSVILPGIGEMGLGVNTVLHHLGVPVQSGLPLTFTGDLQSLQTVIPMLEMPGMGPMVSFGADFLRHFFPETDPAMKVVLGDRGFAAPLLNQIVPNTFLREMYRGANGNVSDSEMASAMSSAMAAAAYHGELPDQSNPAEMQAFIDRIKNNARSAIIMKGIVSLFSPLSNRPVLEDFGLRDEFYKLVQANGGDYQKALLQFEKEHGDSAVSYTVAKSKSVSGAVIPTSQQALDYLNAHSGLLAKYPLAAPFLIPQEGTGGDAQVLHQEALKMGIRAQQTPQELLTSMYVTAGDQQYFNNYRQHLLFLANLIGDSKDAETLKTTTHGVDTAAIEKAAGKTQQGAAEIAGFRQWAAQYSTANPLWHDDFTSTSRTDRAVQSVQQIIQMAAANKIPPGQQAAGVVNLASTYMQVLSQMASAQGQTRAAQTARSQITAAWQTFLGQQMQETPTLTNVIQQVFNRLPTDTTALRNFTSQQTLPSGVGSAV